MAALSTQSWHIGSPGLVVTKPAAGECHIWIVDLQQEEVDLAILSADERQRSERLFAPALRRRSAASRSLLRRLCAAYTGTAPGHLRFTYGHRGKPALDRPSNLLHFNVSHTHDLGVFAFTTDRAVGVDVEEIRTIATLDHLLEDFFSTLDQQWIRDAGEHDQLRRFFRCWTRMEARAKLTGEGLQRSWERTDPGSQRSPQDLDIEFSPTPTTIASIALQGRPPALSFHGLEDLQGELLS